MNQKLDHIAYSLLKLQIKIGVHLINVELSQLLTPQDSKTTGIIYFSISLASFE